MDPRALGDHRGARHVHRVQAPGDHLARLVGGLQVALGSIDLENEVQAALEIEAERGREQQRDRTGDERQPGEQEGAKHDARGQAGTASPLGD